MPTTEQKTPTRRRRNIAAYDPYRKPQWRYDRIQSLLTQGSKIRPREGFDDKYVHTGWRFLKRWVAIGESNSDTYRVDSLRQQLFYDFPGPYLAYQVFLHSADADDGEDLTRVSLEAMVLNNQTHEQIGEKLHMLDEGVEWFEALFFDVRDRLQNRYYISSQIIGPIIGVGLWEMTRTRVARFFGYYANEYILDDILTGYDSYIVPPNPGQSKGPYFDNIQRNTLRRRQAEAANFLDLNKFNIAQFADLHNRIIEENRRSEQGEGARDLIQENIAALLGAIPWSVGQKREQVLENSPLQQYVGHTAELRADQMLRIAAGETLPEVADISKKTFADPRK